MEEKNISYIIAIDGQWIGHWSYYSPQHKYYQRFYSVKHWKRFSNALKRAQQEHFYTNPKALVEIFESWGAHPKQRKLVKSYGSTSKRSEYE